MMVFKLRELPVLIGLLLCGLGVAVCQGQERTGSAAQICSIFESPKANCLSWRKGDVLIRKQLSLDTTNFPDSGSIKGLKGRLEKTETMSRIIFDYDNGIFLHINVTVGSKQVFDDDLPTDPQVISQLTGWMCTGNQGMVASYNTEGGNRLRWNRSQFPEDQDVFLNMIKMPDYRGFWLHGKPVLHGRSHGSAVRASGRDFHSHSIDGEQMKIRYEKEPKEGEAEFGTPVTLVVFDLESLMPTKFNHFNRRANDSPVQGPTFDIRWKAIGDVYVPTKACSRTYRMISAKKEHGPQYDEYQFHWFSLNEDIDTSILDIELFNDREKMVKLVDPILTGADSLLPAKEESEAEDR